MVLFYLINQHKPGSAKALEYKISLMKKFLLLIVFVLVFPASARAGVDGEIFVRYKKGTTASEKTEARSKSQVLDKYSIVPRLELIKTDTPEATLRDLRANENVSYASKNKLRELQADPNDQFFWAQWGLENIGQSFAGETGTAGADIDATLAWQATTGSKSTRVAVIDTGIQLNHPDLADNIWTNPDEIAENGIDDDQNGYIDDIHGWNFINNNNDPSDLDGHGTHVAGIIGADTNNSIGIAGVSQNVSLVALKACDTYCPMDATLAALEYAVSEGIPISNNSYGGNSGSEDLAEKNAIQAAGEAGHLFIAAAGNENNNNDSSTKNYPSSHPLSNIIAVAASKSNDGKASFSSYGQASVDLAAPGNTIASTYKGSSYIYLSGTSMASPQVAGVAALVKSKRPEFNSSQIKSAILENTRSSASWSGKVLTGGILNAAGALRFKPENLSVPPTTISRTATMTWSSLPGAVSFECSLDDASYSSCSSGIKLTNLADGQHSFAVRAVYNYGTSNPSYSDWEVLPSLPLASITSAPLSTHPSKTATIAFSGLAGSTFQCSLNSENYTSCASPVTYLDLASGSYTFRVRQINSGETSEPREISWLIPSVVTMKPTVSGPDQGGNILLSGAAPGHSYMCSINSGAFSDCESTKPLVGLVNGTHQIAAYIKDTNGYTSETETYTFSLTGSPVPPAGAIGAKVSGQYTKSRAIEISLVWPAGTRQVAISDGIRSSQVDISSKIDFTLSPRDGKKLIQINFIGAGGTKIGGTSVGITLDRAPPGLQYIKIIKKTGNKYRVKAILKGYDPLSQVIFSNKTQASKPMAISNSEKSFSLPFKPLSARVRDSAGNWSQSAPVR